MTEQLEETVHKLNDKLAIGSDGKLNIILYEAYKKMDGRGRNATPTGETGWRPRVGGAYHSTLKSLSHSLLNQDVIEAIGEVGLDFDKFVAYIDGKLVEYNTFLTDKITLELAKSKEIIESEEKVAKKK